MSFLIDSAKVAALLAATAPSPSYIVTPVNMPEVGTPTLEAPRADVQSTVSTPPTELIEAHRRLSILRQRLRDKGIAPLSEEDLDREIDDARGR
jgi:hypothetical protein